MREQKTVSQDLVHQTPCDANTGRFGKHTTIVIPAFNEEDGLLAVLNELYEVIDDGYEVLVVDDGSTDATLDVACRFPCRVVKHVANSGKGAAMRTGIALATGENVVFIDADGTYPSDLVPEIVHFLSAGYRYVRCTRRGGRGRIPLINRVGNFFLDTGIAMFSGIWSRDFLTGLYGLKRQDLLDMKIVSQGFDIEAEIAIKAGAIGLEPQEIPFTYRERIGQEKLQSLPDGFRIGLRILNTGIAYNTLLALFAPGILFTLIGLCGLLWIALSGISIEAFIWRVYTFSLISYLFGSQLVVTGLGSNWHAFTQGIRHRIPTWIRWLTNRLSSLFIFWASVLVGACGFALAFLMGPGESTQNFRWGLCLLTIGLQMALLSRSMSIALRLSEQVSQVTTHVEIEK